MAIVDLHWFEEGSNAKSNRVLVIVRSGEKEE